MLEVFSIYKNQSLYMEKKIIFIHVPKAAGTSVARSLYGRSVSHVNARTFRKHFRNNFENTFSFSIVRNPYDRLYSAYSFIKMGGTEDVSIDKRAVYKTEVFDNFESFVVNWLKYVDVSKQDPVFKPQFLYTHDNNYSLLVKKFWKLEEINSFVNYMKENGHSDYTLPHTNKVSSKHSVYDLYTDEMKEIVLEKYEKDFELFGYSKIIQ